MSQNSFWSFTNLQSVINFDIGIQLRRRHEQVYQILLKTHRKDIKHKIASHKTTNQSIAINAPQSQFISLHAISHDCMPIMSIVFRYSQYQDEIRLHYV